MKTQSTSNCCLVVALTLALTASVGCNVTETVNFTNTPAATPSASSHETAFPVVLHTRVNEPERLGTASWTGTLFLIAINGHYQTNFESEDQSLESEVSDGLASRLEARDVYVDADADADSQRYDVLVSLTEIGGVRSSLWTFFVIMNQKPLVWVRFDLRIRTPWGDEFERTFRVVEDEISPERFRRALGRALDEIAHETVSLLNHLVEGEGP